MYEQECVPFAPTLIESMRSIGYSFSSAVADLLDNSIGARATRIDIVSEPSENPSLIIIDNGCGMSDKKLYEAMRYGSSNPLEKRDDSDLGRFGLGLKSASLSQCRKLVVVSKHDDEINAYSWDLDYVIEKGAWMLKGFDTDEIRAFPKIEKLLNMNCGTYLYLNDFDRVREGTKNIIETFNERLKEMEDHIALLFHRFLDDNLIITVNNREIEARDPFLTYHKATQIKRESKIHLKGETITLKPYILPHLSKLTEKDFEKAGGKENLRTEQGFYVYRNRRLIVWGTWFRLERKDELNKLARVRVDIPNSLDYMWSIDIKKSTAILPDIIKKNMYNAVYESVMGSERVHTYRGRKEKKDDNIEYIWERMKLRNGYEYVVNRNIPQIKMLEETLDKEQVKMLDDVIKVLEESFPTASLYVDAAKGNIEEKKAVEGDDKTEELWIKLQEQIRYIKNNGLSEKEYYKAFYRVEPYCDNEIVRQRIKKELEKYE
ncbi:ATP-binding protein [Falcatimonas sp. MSJ-15]|uniref:ATP-binding protein n=1 Tax=Falcatimonas sp. MSJ-15 TaxID=2841515 RepID=UPI001C0F9842|nr:ATP-binding protein [Falcatimonas sp. MSJ-15]MBU5470559.1 ATP-binding protein [Falcatimonas sp. MSJ-15]